MFDWENAVALHAMQGNRASSRGEGRVQSSKSRALMCLIGKMQLLCMECRGIGPHLVARGKSHGFSRVAAGTWGIFSSYDGDAHSQREFV